MGVANGAGVAPEGIEFGWRGLYRVAGVAALAMALFIPVQVLVFILWPPPATVLGWFAVFQGSPIIGLLDMDLLLIVDQVLMGLVLLALYVALRRTSPSATLIALVLALLGIAAYFASTAAFEMLSLSGRYASAAGEAERAPIAAAGEVMLATWQGTAFSLGYLLEGLALLIMALAMRRSSLFGDGVAYLGIAVGILSLVPPTVPTVGVGFAFASLVPLEIWNILLATRFFRTAGSTGKEGLPGG